MLNFMHAARVVKVNGVWKGIYFYWLGTVKVRAGVKTLSVCLLGGTQRLWGEGDDTSTVVGHRRL